MSKLTYINERGQSIVLANSPPLLVTKIDGLGSVQNEIQRQRAPFQDGSTHVGSTLSERQLVIEGVILGKDQETYRRQLIQVFNPKLKGVLRYEKNGVSRAIECVPELAPVLPSDFSKTYQLFMITLLCPSPFWLDVLVEEIQMAAWLGGFEFPLELPTMFASAGSMGYADNKGDVEAPVVIEFTGPATNPKVENVTTGEYVIVKRVLGAGDKLVITTAFGAKGVTLASNGVQSNAIHWLDIDSTFWQLRPGENLIKYTADAGVESATVVVRWQNRFVGV